MAPSLAARNRPIGNPDRRVSRVSVQQIGAMNTSLLCLGGDRQGDESRKAGLSSNAKRYYSPTRGRIQCFTGPEFQTETLPNFYLA